MKELDRRGTYVDNIADFRVRAVVSRIADSCRCFMLSPRWDGHTINPPCETILTARMIVADLDGIERHAEKSVGVDLPETRQ